MNNKYSIVVEAATKAAEKELEQLGKRSEAAFDRARVAANALGSGDGEGVVKRQRSLG